MHPESTRFRQLVAPLFIIGLMVSGVLAFTPWAWLGLVVPGAYLMLLATSTLVQLIRSRDPAALLFPAAVATMHLSWGLGFLAGG
jgi:hypothetical protein